LHSIHGFFLHIHHQHNTTFIKNTLQLVNANGLNYAIKLQEKHIHLRQPIVSRSQGL
jgi:hypothetical protein